MAAQQPNRGPWHDRYFRSNFQHPQRILSLLQLALTPQQLSVFDLDSLQVMGDSSVDDHELIESVFDLKCQVRLHNQEHVMISFIVDHKSHTDSRVFRQLLRYIAVEYQRGVSAVVPIVIYHGQVAWYKKKTFHAFEHAKLPGEFLNKFKHHLVNFEAVFVNLRELFRQGVHIPELCEH